MLNHKLLILIFLIGSIILYSFGFFIPNQQIYENFESYIDLITDNINIKGRETIDLVDEFRRLRHMLDKYDTDAIEFPYDKEILRKRSELEHLLTKIVIYVKKYGNRAYIRDLERLIMQ
jgi:hypothetical protein